VFLQAGLEELRGLLQQQDMSETSQMALLSLPASVPVDLEIIRYVHCGADGAGSRASIG